MSCQCLPFLMSNTASPLIAQCAALSTTVSPVSLSSLLVALKRKIKQQSSKESTKQSTKQSSKERQQPPVKLRAEVPRPRCELCLQQAGHEATTNTTVTSVMPEFPVSMSELRVLAGAGAGPEPDSAPAQRHGAGHQGRSAQGPGGHQGQPAQGPGGQHRDTDGISRHGPGHQGQPAQGPGGQRGRQQDVEQRQAEVT